MERTTVMRRMRNLFCAALCLSALSCGGGGGGTLTSSGSSSTTPPAGSNVVSVVVNAGPTANSPDVNTLFTTVTVCLTGTTNCQTIDNIQVDTASYGLRIMASVLTLALPIQTTSNGDSLLECTQFVDGYSWGPVALADVQVSGETASSVPLQIIGDTNFTNVPSDCSSTGPSENTVASFGANGILGIGVFAQDCGPNCVSTASNEVYYACTSTSAECQGTTVALTSQVPNPITFFTTDNNGVIIELPAVAAGGAASVTGSMIFGVDTESNNQSGSQSVLTVDSTYGDFTTVYSGQTLSQSFLDTGSNGLYFNDSTIPTCTETGFTDFYCPTSTLALSATLEGLNGISTTANFSVANAETLGANDVSLVAFSNFAGTFPSNTDSFDWGLPFYYGRTVYTVIQNATTSVGTGPYVAF
jgi:Protein of unknown function (DUF3443)